MKKFLYCASLFVAGALYACHTSRKYDSWPAYGGSNDRIHYSGLQEIDTGNVGRLRQVWTYHCGDVDSNSQIQCNPIVIGHTLYGVSPQLKLFALDAVSGQVKWRFDPAKLAKVGNWTINNCRGIAYYQ